MTNQIKTSGILANLKNFQISWIPSTFSEFRLGSSFECFVWYSHWCATVIWNAYRLIAGLILVSLWHCFTFRLFELSLLYVLACIFAICSDFSVAWLMIYSDDVEFIYIQVLNLYVAGLIIFAFLELSNFNWFYLLALNCFHFQFILLIL